MKYRKTIVSAVLLGTILITVGCGEKKSAETTPTNSIDKKKESATQTTDNRYSKDPASLAQKDPQVVIDTSLGSITIQLNAKDAPGTVANFMAYMDEGLYDQTIFHEVYKDQAIVAGGYAVNLADVRTKMPIRNEAYNGLKNLRKTIGMLRQPDVIDSATSQFYINTVDNPALDNRTRDLNDPEAYGYCVFGEVVSGMDVVDKIAISPVKDTDKFDRTPVNAVVIKSVRRVK